MDGLPDIHTRTLSIAAKCVVEDSFSSKSNQTTALMLRRSDLQTCSTVSECEGESTILVISMPLWVEGVKARIQSHIELRAEETDADEDLRHVFRGHRL